jgi:enterochelin esterase-like enzyme
MEYETTFKNHTLVYEADGEEIYNLTVYDDEGDIITPDRQTLSSYEAIAQKHYNDTYREYAPDHEWSPMKLAQFYCGGL